MSAMGDIAVELELHWHAVAASPVSEAVCWWRTLPNGSRALIVRHADGSHSLSMDVLEIWQGDDLSEAIVAAGALAKQQLRELEASWI